VHLSAQKLDWEPINVFGSYLNEKNPMTKLQIHNDSTFDYYDWYSGSCWAQVHKSGCFRVEQDTLILISRGECASCFEYESMTNDSVLYMIDFDSQIRQSFPDYRISFDFEFEDNIVPDKSHPDFDRLVFSDNDTIPFVINLRSDKLNSDIFMDYYADTTSELNHIIIRIKEGYEQNFQKQEELFARYLILKNNLIKCGLDSSDIAVNKLKKKKYN